MMKKESCSRGRRIRSWGVFVECSTTRDRNERHCELGWNEVEYERKESSPYRLGQADGDALVIGC